MGKHAFQQHGDYVDESIFMNHLGGMPLFIVTGQWGRIGPIFEDWVSNRRWLLMVYLLGHVLLAFYDRLLDSRVVSRAPSVLLAQLVQTLKKFLILLVTILLNAPPWPIVSFWAGNGLVV